MSKKSSVDSNNYYLYPEWFEGGNQSQPSTSSYSYPTLEYIWSNAVRLIRTVHSNLQDEIEYLEKNISGGGGSCNCSELQYGIDKNSTKIYYNSVNITSNANKIANLSDIKLSRDGSQPMEGELICNSGLKTDMIKARTQSIIDCQNQLRVYQSLGGDGDYGLWLGSDFSPEAPSIYLYPYGSSAEGKILIKTPRSDGITVPRIEVSGKIDFADIKIRESNIIPYDDNYQDLGGDSNRWKNIYAVSGNFSGTIIPDAILTNSANISDLDARVDYLEENLSTCNCSALQFGIDSNTTKIENLSVVKLSRDGSQSMTGILKCESGIETNTIYSYSGDKVECSDDFKVDGNILGDSVDGLSLKAEEGDDVAEIELSPGSTGRILMSTPTSQGVVLPRLEIPDGTGNVDITISNAHIIPSINNWQDLGNSNKRWKDIYAVSGNFSGIVIPNNIINLGPYFTIVYKDDTGVYAKDASGNIIAQGDAGTDDATVLKTALESGGKIIIMPATYTLYFTVTGSTNLIILPDNTTIDGLVSHKTIFEFYIDGSTPGAGQHYNIAEIFTGSCCRIANLTINGKKSYFAPKNYLQYLIYSVNKSSVLIENVNLFHSSRCGIVPESENMIIRNVYAEDCLMSMDAISMHQVEVDGYIAKSCENAFYIETGGGTNVFLRNFHFEDCLRGFYTLSNLSNVVIEEGTIKTKNDYSARGIIAQQTSKLFTIKNVKINAPYGYAFSIKGENLGDIIVSNCYSDSYNGFKAHRCIVDGGYYKANYLFTVSSDHLLIKNANLYTTYRMFYDHVSDIHFENCELNLITSDGTESDITFRRCTIGSKKTDNSGTATISSGNTSVVVSHGLFKAPVRVFLTGTHNEVAKCWVSNISDTEFTINAPSAVTDDRDVYWDAAMS